MPDNFQQWLVMILIGLLFGKEYILTPVLKKWGIAVDEKKDTSLDSQWRGEVTTTLKYMQSDIQQIKEDSKAMRDRLGQHLDDEEEKLDELNMRLHKLE